MLPKGNRIARNVGKVAEMTQSAVLLANRLLGALKASRGLSEIIRIHKLVVLIGGGQKRAEF
jgi:hypothetical protein